MTKEEVLQKVNDYCTERQYTSSTLTDGFKDKFAEHFVKSNPEGDINDETVLNSMRFAINTAYSSACDIATVKTNEFTQKENGYKSQIEELNKKVVNPQAQKVEIPDEIKNQLAELEKFKANQSKQEKFKTIVGLAKNEIRRDLHASFEKFAADYEVKLDKEDKEQANALVSRFQEIFKDSIGDIKPLSPSVAKKMDEEFLASIKEVKVC